MKKIKLDIVYKGIVVISLISVIIILFLTMPKTEENIWKGDSNACNQECVKRGHLGGGGISGDGICICFEEFKGKRPNVVEEILNDIEEELNEIVETEVFEPHCVTMENEIWCSVELEREDCLNSGNRWLHELEECMEEN